MDKMLVSLKNLQPNPHRDFRIDPIDEEVVEALQASIEEDGVWGGVVCREVKVNGGTVIQIAAGHHRIEAAKRAGIKTADLFVGKFDDASMIRVYARENATQRGSTGAALAGTVAAAIRYLAKGIISGTFSEIRERSLETARGQIATGRGIGQRIILEFLEKVPGITRNVVDQQTANLKASGDYARILGEV